MVFEKKANFFAKNCQKSPKIVIIISTPGRLLLAVREHPERRRRPLVVRKGIIDRSMSLWSSG
jgi:hypothetical protein